MRILVTGGAGFVGSNLSLAFKSRFSEYEVIAFDNLKRRGSELNIARFKAEGVQFIHGDIRNVSDLAEVGPIDLLIDACAEPSVQAGLNGSPDYLIDTNLVGTINCLNYAKQHKAKFVFLSTSRIYPIAPIENARFIEAETRFEFENVQAVKGISSKGISEELSIEGYRSLYGATKLASELLIHEYVHFLGLEAVINRCGVLTGPWQMGKVDQGFVVLWLARHFWKKDLKYIGYGGKGKQVRDILHVDDLFEAICLQLNLPQVWKSNVFNLGGGKEISFSLVELTKLCQELTGNTIQFESVPETNHADVRVYISNTSKAQVELNWKPKKSKEIIVSEVFDWLKSNESVLKPILY